MKRFVLNLTVCLLGVSATQAAGVKICIEAEGAPACELPMVVASNGVAGASGAYLEIPEGAGNPP